MNKSEKISVRDVVFEDGNNLEDVMEVIVKMLQQIDSKIGFAGVATKNLDLEQDASEQEFPRTE